MVFGINLLEIPIENGKNLVYLHLELLPSNK